MTKMIIGFRSSANQILSVFLVRLALGWIFLYEGTGKLFGFFGGGGIDSIAAYFRDLGIPYAHFNAYLVGTCEFLAGICFVLGFLIRPAAAVVLIIMATAIITAHRSGGYNYPMLIGFVCILLLEHGAGKYSLNSFISKKS
jgi:putative oxidoreductase